MPIYSNIHFKLSKMSEPVEENASLLESKTLEKERLWTTLLSTFIVCIMAFMQGCVVGYPSPVLLQLENAADPHLRFNPTLSGLFAASALLGGLLIGPVAGWVGDKWGRKTSLMLCALPFSLGYFLIVSASVAETPKALLLVGRVITGLGVGWVILAVPVYVGEISSTKLRGVLSALPELFLTAGILFVYSIGLVPGFQYFHIALVLEGVLLLYMLLVLWIPESPRWLLIRNMEEQAEEVMKFLRGPRCKTTISKDIEAIKNAISNAPQLTLLQSLKKLVHKSALVPVILVVALLVCQQITGVGIINAYTGPIFQKAGVNNPQIAAIVKGLAQFIATAVGTFMVSLLGRKFLLILSSSGMLTGATMLGAHFYITRPALCANPTNETGLTSTMSDSPGCNSQYAPLAIVSLSLFIVLYEIGWGPVSWVLMSEYLPLQVRGIGTGIGVASFAVSATVVIFVYPVYEKLVSQWFAWWTFSLINLIALVFVVVFIVETKGKSLEEIQSYFERKYSKEKHTLQLKQM